MSTHTARVALLGFGTVGRAVAQILTERPPAGVRLTHIYNRNVARKHADWVSSDVVWTDDIEAVFASDADVIVELIGGRDPAGAWVRRALESGRSVVTANKQLIAHEGRDLLRLASDRRRHLRFEATVAGGIPVIGALRDGIAGDRIERIAGILNGTCNYILTSMESAGATFAEALATAQALGYAETDPTDDVEGYDARAKLAILCAVGLRVQVAPADIACRPITVVDAVDFQYADQLQCTIRQISQAELDPADPTRVIASVRPSLVPRRSMLARAGRQQEPDRRARALRRRHRLQRIGRRRRADLRGGGLGPGRHRRARAGTARRDAAAAGLARRPGVPDRALPAVRRQGSARRARRAGGDPGVARHQHRRGAAAERCTARTPTRLS